MGMGISDLSVGVEVLRRARANGVGRPLAPTLRAKPRLGGGGKV
jgi:alanine dehydrogenase